MFAGHDGVWLGLVATLYKDRRLIYKQKLLCDARTGVAKNSSDRVVFSAQARRKPAAKAPRRIKFRTTPELTR